MKYPYEHIFDLLDFADLDCSLHVRGLTVTSKLSRSQLREQISVEGRIARLETNIREKLLQ